MKKLLLIVFLIFAATSCSTQDKDKFELFEQNIYFPKQWEWIEKSGYYGRYYSDLDNIILMTSFLRGESTDQEIMDRIHESYNAYNTKPFSFTYDWSYSKKMVNGKEYYIFNTGNDEWPEVYGRRIKHDGKERFVSVSTKINNGMQEIIKKVFRE